MTGNSLLLLNSTAHLWLEVVWRASWQGGLAILLVGLVCRLAPKLPANVRAILWWLACFKLIAGLMSPVLLPILPATFVSPATHPSVLISNAEPNRQPVPLIRIVSLPPHAIKPTIEALVFLGWMSLTGVLLANVAARSINILRVRGAAHDARPGLQEMAASIATSMRMKYVPRVLMSLCLKVPVAVGILKPAILISEAAEQELSDGELQMILTHEMAHIKRGDLFLSLLPAYVRTVFFFHPLAWLAAREFAIAREEACDAETLRVTQQQPGNYGRLLLKIIDSGRQPESAAALGVATNHRHLERRLKMLGNVDGSLMGRSRIMVTGVVISAAFWVLPWKLTAQELSPGGHDTIPPAPTGQVSLGGSSPIPGAPQTARESGSVVEPRIVSNPKPAQPTAPGSQVPSSPSTALPGTSMPKQDAKPGVGIQWTNASRSDGKSLPGSSSPGVQWVSPPKTDGRQVPGTATPPTLWRYPANTGGIQPVNAGMDYVVSNDFGSTTIYEVIRYVFDTAGVSYRIDEDVERIARETKLTLSANNVPLRRILEMALAASRSKSKPLTYNFDNGFYVISFLETNVPGGIPEKPGPTTPGRNRPRSKPGTERAPGIINPTPPGPGKEGISNPKTPSGPVSIAFLEIREAETTFSHYSSVKRDLQSKLQADLLVYTANHPHITQLKAQIADADSQISQSRAALSRLTSQR